MPGGLRVLMYAKIFRQIYDGTLAADWQALVTFQQLLVLADPEGVVDMTPDAISRTTGIPLVHIQAGLKSLVEPDTMSRTPTAEGRRILPIAEHRDWGWTIVNIEHYRGMKDADQQRAYHRNWYHEHRSKQARLDQETQTNSNELKPTQDKKKKKKSYEEETDNRLGPPDPDSDPEFLAAWKIYPKRPNNSRQAAWEAFRKSVKRGADPVAVTQGVKAYADYCAATEKSGEYIKQAATFFGPGKHWEATYDTPADASWPTVKWDNP